MAAPRRIVRTLTGVPTSVEGYNLARGSPFLFSWLRTRLLQACGKGWI